VLDQKAKRKAVDERNKLQSEAKRQRLDALLPDDIIKLASAQEQYWNWL